MTEASNSMKLGIKHPGAKVIEVKSFANRGKCNSSDISVSSTKCRQYRRVL